MDFTACVDCGCLLAPDLTHVCATQSADDWNEKAALWLEQLDPREIERLAMARSRMSDSLMGVALTVIAALLRGEELA